MFDSARSDAGWVPLQSGWFDCGYRQGYRLRPVWI
jgi:hypothetical protein